MSLHGEAGVDCIHISGSVKGKELRWLVDSGASHNFVSEQFVRDHRLETVQERKVQVKLANGNFVETATFLHVVVDFGVVSGFLKYTVLPCCPLVLGMPFLRYFNPTINW